MPRVHDGGGCRVATDHEVPRRAEHGEHHRRDEDRVQTGDDRRARDPRVAHDLRDGERRKGDAGDHVLGQQRSLVGPDALEERDRVGERTGSAASGLALGVGIAVGHLPSRGAVDSFKPFIALVTPDLDLGQGGRT